jgi:hypothetical protein
MSEFLQSEANRSKLAENFTKCVKGYHIVNDDPIKESPWEDINAQVLEASGCIIDTKSNGSHKSGADISCSVGSLSNKSTQYEPDGKSFKISSYRLTTVCSDKEPGTIEEIVTEIEKRKNFQYYSIIVRNCSESNIVYDWFLIPCDYPQFNPASYGWTPKTGKIGKNKGAITGWETNDVLGSSMSITFSMSSQLWLHIEITEEMLAFRIASCTVEKKRRLNYIQLFERYLDD